MNIDRLSLAMMTVIVHLGTWVVLLALMFVREKALPNVGKLSKTAIFLSALLPFLLPWILILSLRSKGVFQNDFPLNAIGGMAVGFGAVSWLTGTMLTMGAQFRKSQGWGILRYFLSVSAPATLAMIAGAYWAIGLKHDRSWQLVLAAPLVGAISFVFFSYTIAGAKHLAAQFRN